MLDILAIIMDNILIFNIYPNLVMTSGSSWLLTLTIIIIKYVHHVFVPADY